MGTQTPTNTTFLFFRSPKLVWLRREPRTSGHLHPAREGPGPPERGRALLDAQEHGSGQGFQGSGQ